MRHRKALIAILLIVSLPARAETNAPADQLHQLEGQLAGGHARDAELAATADKLNAERAALQQQMVSAADAMRRREADADLLAQDLEQLKAEETQSTMQLDQQRTQLGTLLGALERLSRVPPEAVLGSDQSPTDMLRSALLLRDMVPTLRDQAAALADKLNDLAHTRQDIAERQKSLSAARADLDKQRANLADLLAQRDAMAESTRAERAALAARMAKLSLDVASLRELIVKVEAEHKTATQEAAMAPPPLSTPQAGQQIVIPVSGIVTVRFGKPDHYGTPSRGITLRTNPGAMVVAPRDGKVRFAGPFKGYGLIIIIDHNDGYHSLLSGLGSILTSVGSNVLAGEPIGAMATAADDETNDNHESEGVDNQSHQNDNKDDLYFEFRHNGQPVNPQSLNSQPMNALRGPAAHATKGQG